MLLNTDLHSQSASRKMSCTEFIENLAELNDGDNFPREILKSLYHAIKTHPLEWALYAFHFIYNMYIFSLNHDSLFQNKRF